MKNCKQKSNQRNQLISHFFAILIFFCGFVASPTIATNPQVSSSIPPQISLSQKHVILFYSSTLSLPVYRKHFNTYLSLMEASGISLTNIHFEFLDITRINNPDYQQYLSNILLKKYKGIKFEVIVTIGDVAQDFITNHGTMLFQETPIITIFTLKKVMTTSPGCPIIQIGPDINISGTNEIALKLFPETKHVFVIVGASEIEKQWVSEARKALPKRSDTINFEFTNNYTYNEMLIKASSLPSNSVILFVSYFQDETGKPFVPETVLQSLTKVAKSPVFGTYEEILGKGIIGGSLLSNENTSIRSAQLSCDILNEKLILTDSVITIANTCKPMFDWDQLQRWKIRTTSLPPQSIIINHHASLWETYRWYIVSIIIIFIVQTLLIIGMIVQRRNRNIAVKALQASELMHKSMTANISDAIAIVSRDGRIRYISPNIEKLFGWRPEDLVGLEGLSMIHPEDAMHFKYNFEGLLKKDNLVKTSEYQFKEKNGNYRLIKLTAINLTKDPTVDGILMNFFDITEQKIAQNELQQTQLLLKSTLRSIGDGVITTDVNGNILMLNNAAELLTEWNSAEAVGRPLLEVFNIINELTRQRCEDPVKKVLTTESIIQLTYHTRLITKNGSEILIANSCAPIRNNENCIMGVVLVFRDMTEKQKLDDSMQRAQKLESLGVLAGGIAHDFNNLLGGIFGYLDLAKVSIAVGRHEDVPEFLENALGVFDRARALTQQLLTFSKGGAPIRKTIQLSQLIKKNTQFALSGSNVSSQFNIADDLWFCDCDENQMGQVIDNIVINAMQAMSEGGQIIITAKNISINNEHNSIHSRNGNFVKVSIKDHGIGIPKEILPRIFDPFFSTKETGHGLGLATVFSIVQRHNGWIDVESEKNIGSTFHFFLPASQKVNTSIANLTYTEHKGQGTILIMDDEDFMLKIIRGLLENMGYSVVQTKDGNEAIRLFIQAETSGKPFSATILDLTIPGGIGGKETVVELRKINPHSVIIASSGYSEDPVMSDPTDHGFTEKIIKPFTKNELTDLLKKIFSHNG